MSQTITLFDADHGSKRVCGDCQLCCKLLPVKSIDKPGWKKCQHQRHGKGCMVYTKPEMPFECRVWSCRWLTQADTAGLARPDRSHYVIDCMPDMVRTEGPDGAQEWMAIQIWCDPAFPDAHRDPALRAYIERRAQEEGLIAMIRLRYGTAIIMVAPCLTGSGDWVERTVTASAMTGSGNRFVDQLAGGVR